MGKEAKRQKKTHEHVNGEELLSSEVPLTAKKAIIKRFVLDTLKQAINAEQQWEEIELVRWNNDYVVNFLCDAK